MEKLYEQMETSNNQMTNPSNTHISRVLDIGCGEGNLGSILKNHFGTEVYGIEISSHLAEKAAGKLTDILCEDIETCSLPYEHEFFDQIILSDILQHLHDPWATLKKVKPYLKPSGTVVARIPNVAHISILMDLLEGRWEYSETGLLDEKHLRFFTRQEIVSLFEKAGYEIISIKNMTRSSEVHENLIDRLDTVMSDLNIGNPHFSEESRIHHYVIEAKKGTNITPNKQVDENSFLFVTCVDDEEAYQKCQHHIQQLMLPEGYRFDYFQIRKATNMAQAYNVAINHPAKYKIYIKQNTFILNKNFLHDLLDLFHTHPKLGLVGMIGSETIPSSGVWWESPDLIGKLIHCPDDLYQVVSHSMKMDAPYTPVQAMDGCLMATQYDVPWKEDLFDGSHFYDSSQTQEFIQSGYEVGIPYQHEPWCLHSGRHLFTLQEGDEGYKRNQKAFQDTYINRM
ncbi:2-polyprenyl-3-methyl-5-hydroxy-6-metoxy-1,4-benzoquinol methylase [Croceifilum oryzae]|uniref:2-polyprenyl-3-methyl-5-hydroxy-6-metoxy-1, 4-benzoquinol methylase n=1 Tax=Croceifilum oryzae TaxID=1553429 RepID=A0AAJ1TEN3_9BACL|nr:glycosyltransferase [Croceifilum oryzae]MDQ0417074.1 2-polyprenyl-3-methyl-5-hydroxy-6-metoxy-1,4-benzoquinol methylase [Croceifilum oryzae]